MKIWIEHNALVSDREELLAAGVIYGILRLQELGHDVGFLTYGLTEQQETLLEHEQIEPQFSKQSESDVQVHREEEEGEPGPGLQLLNEDETVMETPDWKKLVLGICFPRRSAELERKSSETRVQIKLNLDGTGEADIDTGIGFFDHMLEQIAKHGLIDLELTCDGDLDVDEHHTIEDSAIALGTAIEKALGDKTGITRYAFVLPMDESRSKTVLDLSGRPYFEFRGSFNREMVGAFPTEMTEHFFRSLAMNLKATLHIHVDGDNDHHKIEACFKSFARCLRAAVSRSERTADILPSTKDLL